MSPESKPLPDELNMPPESLEKIEEDLADENIYTLKARIIELENMLENFGKDNIDI